MMYAGASGLRGRGQAEELAGRILAEIVLFDVDLPRERHLARPRGRIFRIVDRLHLLDLACRVVFDHDFQRPEHGQHSRARRFRSSRRAFSSTAMSIVLLNLATPMRSQKLRMASGV